MLNDTDWAEAWLGAVQAGAYMGVSNARMAGAVGTTPASFTRWGIQVRGKGGQITLPRGAARRKDLLADLLAFLAKEARK